MIYISGIFLLNTTTTTHTFLLASQNVCFLNDFTMQYFLIEKKPKKPSDRKN